MAGLPHFYYHPRMLAYDFGPQHPLKPVRLERTIACTKALYPWLQCIEPGYASEEDVLLVHDEDYLEFVLELTEHGTAVPEELFGRGFSTHDTPPFPGIYQAALAYSAGSARAAKDVCEGAMLAINAGGGLHHAQRYRASGFCVFNDPAMACAILKQKFNRVMYVDIDLHHGDGVQAIFLDDPDVITFSIHETGRVLYPGTGFIQERGAGMSVINVPLEPGTTGDLWLQAFTEVFRRAVDVLKPEAFVLQMGCDPHRTDPLGHLECDVQSWLGAVKEVRDVGLPIVAMSGGGYDIANVPRMWSAAFLTLGRLEVPARMPDKIPVEWGCREIFDPPLGPGQSHGHESVETIIDYWSEVLR